MFINVSLLKTNDKPFKNSYKCLKGLKIDSFMKMNEMIDVAKFLFKNKITAHIDTKDKDFYNGLIIEMHETFLVIKDRVIGLTPISFSNVDVIEKFRGVN